MGGRGESYNQKDKGLEEAFVLVSALACGSCHPQQTTPLLEETSAWGEMPNSWVKHESPRLQRLNWAYNVTEVSGQTYEEMVPQSPLSEE